MLCLWRKLRWSRLWIGLPLLPVDVENRIATITEYVQVSMGALGESLMLLAVRISSFTIELSTLNSQIRLKLSFSVPGILVLPETFTVNSLNAYIDMTTLPTVSEARNDSLV